MSSLQLCIEQTILFKVNLQDIQAIYCNNTCFPGNQTHDLNFAIAIAIARLYKSSKQKNILYTSDYIKSCDLERMHFLLILFLILFIY